MIVVDSCKANYQIWLITCLKLIIKIANHAWREKKHNRLNYRCKECNGTSNKSVNDLIEKFPRMCKFCNGNLSKFVMLLGKGVYPYEYMDSWERFFETSLLDKIYFYSELNVEDISD